MCLLSKSNSCGLTRSNAVRQPGKPSHRLPYLPTPVTVEDDKGELSEEKTFEISMISHVGTLQRSNAVRGHSQARIDLNPQGNDVTTKAPTANKGLKRSNAVRHRPEERPTKKVKLMPVGSIPKRRNAIQASDLNELLNGKSSTSSADEKRSGQVFRPSRFIEHMCW